MRINAEDTTLEITRVFDAPPARVFDAWLNREEWQAWIGPEGVNCEVPLLEPRVGGRYRIAMHLSDGRVIPVAGVFKIIDAPRTLAFTWGWEGTPHARVWSPLPYVQRAIRPNSPCARTALAASPTATITAGAGTARSTSSPPISNQCEDDDEQDGLHLCEAC
jgi:uncharacterized protein YndB with AHSA1/START domain